MSLRQFKKRVMLGMRNESSQNWKEIESGLKRLLV
jgi:hypothetical protein